MTSECPARVDAVLEAPPSSMETDTVIVGRFLLNLLLSIPMDHSVLFQSKSQANPGIFYGQQAMARRP